MSANMPIERALLTLVFVGVALAVVIAMRHAWNAKMRAQSQLAALPEFSGEVSGPGIPGRYLGTVTANDWLNRIVVRGLGFPSMAELFPSDTGYYFRLQGENDLFIPFSAITQLHLDRAIAGKVYEKDGILVWRWSNLDQSFATGFRPTHTEDQIKILTQYRKQTTK